MSSAWRSAAPKSAAASAAASFAGQAGGDGHLDEGAPGGAVVHREPGDEPPAASCNEHLSPGPRSGTGELAEDRLRVDAG